MDTIIYFYKKRGLKEPEVEPVGLKTYMLVRVGMDVGKEEWFGTKLKEGKSTAEAGESGGTDFPLPVLPEQTGTFLTRLLALLRHPLKTLGQRCEDKKQQRMSEEQIRRVEEERARLLEEREEGLWNMEVAMEKLSVQILDLAEDVRNCFCVYDGNVRKALVEPLSQDASEGDWQREYLEGESGKTNREKTMTSLWRACFPVPEFAGFKEPFWVEQLLAEALLPHFVILGTAPHIHEMIEGMAHKMKSLRWILLEEDCGGELLDFVEDFYTEYGLAVTMQPLESWAMLRRTRLVCEVPVNVLDFTGEPHIAVSEVAAGSVWLDMMSVEEKCRRIRGQGRDIAYFSLKEKWRHAQKRCNCPILP